MPEHGLVREELMGDDADLEIGRLLQGWSAGDRESAYRLIPILYEDLRRRARMRLAGGGPASLTTTSLVHETFLKLVDGCQVAWQDRTHFLSVASLVMRQIVVDHARHRLAHKRGGDVDHQVLDESRMRLDMRAQELVDVDAALDGLKAVDERLGRVVELHFFGGLSFDEIGEAMEVSARTAKRDWRKARAFLHDALAPTAHQDDGR